jgi:divalent metal cation (Fe/Co/Zn/Cd) transporter
MPQNLRRKALFLSWFTVGYNLLEGVLSIIAGAIAGSVALVGFGLDSFVESLSGGIMIWRLRKGDTFTMEEEERKEHRALTLIGWTFFLFAAYVFFESGEKLILREAPEPSLFGIAIAAVSSMVMPVLYVQKLRTGIALGLRSLIADSKETLACVYLSLSLITGLGLNYLFGWWWADPVTGILIAFFLIREGREALGEEKETEVTDIR